MNYEDILEIAVRNKYRFPYKGLISVEDLWDLTVQDLDRIYKTLNAEAKKSQEESLLQVRDKNAEVLSNKIEIIKHIVSVKGAEALAAKAALDRKAQKQRIMEIIAAKEDAALQGKSLEELQKMVDEM